ncbi:MAG TPA: STAS domain-containing protein [Gallionella sp.]|jgi:phospholipid transport system transporter-binding protein|nr:STAS domain-containing protein [Gallionella sp.]
MIEREDGRLVVRGRLTIATVPALFEAGLQYLAGEDLLVDFSQVEAVDSAAVSMLLGWLRAAQRSRHTLRVTSLPEDLLSLAHLYGVADLLPQQSA